MSCPCLHGRTIQINSFSFFGHSCWLYYFYVPESIVTVKLWSRTTQVTVGQNVALMCWLIGSDLPMTVTWSLQRENSSSLDNILTSYANGDISWSGEHRRYQLKRESQKNRVHHSLLINGVSLREAGRYQCEPSVFLGNRHKRLQAPSLLAVMVKIPGNSQKKNTRHLVCVWTGAPWMTSDL